MPKGSNSIIGVFDKWRNFPDPNLADTQTLSVPTFAVKVFDWNLPLILIHSSLGFVIPGRSIHPPLLMSLLYLKEDNINCLKPLLKRQCCLRWLVRLSSYFYRGLFQPFKNINTIKNKPVCEVAVDIFHEYCCSIVFYNFLFWYFSGIN